MASIVSGNETQQLYPAKIARATNGVISDQKPPDGVPVQGVPLGIFEDVRRKDGTLAAAVKVLVDPPLDPDQYDEITLWLNGVQIGLPQKVGNQIIAFDLFQSDLRDSITNVIQYKLKTHPGTESKSTELWALYSATLPGGNDVPGNGEHPGLGISLPAELGNPPIIGKDEVDQGVLVTFDYPCRKAHDKITYEINRERFTYTVKPDEVDKPVSVLIDRAKFELIGSLEHCAFSYTVIDQLLNATYQRRWSASIFANLDLERLVLDEPLLQEILDAPNDDPNEIDLAKLAEKDLSAVIMTSSSRFEPGDTIKAEYVAKLEGHTDIVQHLSGTVETDELGEKKRCILKIPNAKVIFDSSVTMTYELFRPNEEPVGKSRTANAKVVGKHVWLEPAKIKEAINDVLDPIAAKDKLTAIVPAYPNMIGTQISVTWSGTAGGGSATVGPFSVTTQADQEIDLPNSVVAFNFARAACITYTVIRNGIPQDSRILSLCVLSIGNGDINLPAPTIADADESTGTLFLPNFIGNTRVMISVWPLIAAGQKLWVRCEGEDSNGDPLIAPIYQSTPITHTEPQEGQLLRSFLDKLAHDSQISVYASVNFEELSDSDTAIEFPVRNYIVKKFLMEDFELCNVGEIRVDTLDLAEMTLVHEVRPNAMSTIIDTKQIPPHITGKSYRTMYPANDEVNIFLKRAWESVKFDIFVNNYYGALVRSYDEGNKIIEERRLTSNPDSCELKGFNDQKIKRIQIFSHPFSLDNITLNS